MKKIFIFIVFILSSTTSLAQNVVQNLQTAAVLDVLAPIHFENSENNKLDIRSTELIFLALWIPPLTEHWILQLTTKMEKWNQRFMRLT